MEFHSRGGGGPVRKDQSPKQKNPIKKSRRKKLTGSRSQVPPRRTALELCTKLGSQTSDPWRGVHVGAGPECRWECVEDIQSCVTIVHCVGVSCSVGSSASRYILTHRKTHAWSENASQNSKQRREVICLATFRTGEYVEEIEGTGIERIGKRVQD